MTILFDLTPADVGCITEAFEVIARESLRRD
jgi:hypothetical protein